MIAAALCAAAAQPCRAAELRTLVNTVRSLMDSPSGGGASLADIQAFEKAICDAYKVSSVDKLKGRVSIALLTGTSLKDDLLYFEYGADRIKADSAASAIKTALLVYYAHMVETGDASPKEVVAGRSLGAHAERMIRYSDNASANALLDRFGMDAINAWYEELGFPAGELQFRRHFSGNPSADPNSPDNTASAEALTLLYFLIAQQNDILGFLSAQGLHAVRLMLSNQKENQQNHPNNEPQFNDRLGKKFPSGVVFIHKTGSNTEVIADAGIAYNGKQTFIIVAFDTRLDKAAMQRLGLNLLKLMKKRPLRQAASR